MEGKRHWKVDLGRAVRAVCLCLAALLVDGCTRSSGSDSTIVPPPSPPGAPDGVMATAGNGQVTVSWNAVVAATSYNLYFASASGVTKTNFGSLPDGAMVVAVASPHVQMGLANGTTHYFVVTALNASGESVESMEVSATPAIPSACPTPILPAPQGAFYPITGTLRDLVYDTARDRVYITNETANAVEIFDVGSSSLLAPVAVGSQPWGLDLTPDGSRLLVCLTGASLIAVVDLTVDPPVAGTPLTVTPDLYGTSQPRTIGCGSNNLAFFTCVYPGSGSSVPRQIDLATMNITERTDMQGGSTRDPTWIGVAGDRSHLFFAEGNTSSGEYFVYEAASNTFTTDGWLETFNDGAAADATGSRFLALPSGDEVETDLRIHGRYMPGTMSGFVYAPSGDRAYAGIDGQPEIAVIDTMRRLPIDRIATPASLTGNLKIDPSGTVVYAIGQGGLLAVPVDVNRPPVLEPLGGAVVNVGETVGLLVQATDADGDPIVYCADNLPSNATFDPVTRLFSFSPNASQGGMTFTVTFNASDGGNATSQDLIVNVTDPVSYPMRKIPIWGTLGEGVYDPATGLLYVANSTMNRVEVIRVADNTRLDPIPVGSAPWGIDLDAASTKMVVCPSESELVQVVDLLAVPPSVSQSIGLVGGILGHKEPFAVAVAANDHAFITPWYVGSGWVNVQDLDLATNLIIERLDTGGSVSEPCYIRASGDRSALFIGEGDISSGEIFIYDSPTDTFSPDIWTSSFISGIDANDDGTRFMVAPVTPGIAVYDDSLTLVGSFSGSFEVPAFRRGFLEGFAHNWTSTVSLLDTSTYLVTGNITLPEAAEGWMRTDDAGTRLFVVSQTGVCIVTLP